MSQSIHVEATAEAACVYVTRRIAQQLRESFAKKPRASFVAAGGNTFRHVYELLAHDSTLDWTRVDLFLGDERAVGPESVDSNYRMIHESWLHHYAGGQGPKIHRILGEKGAQTAAREYRYQLKQFGLAGDIHFDVVLLGVGPDGHTASLFPSSFTHVLESPELVSVTQPDLPPPIERITMTPMLFNQAKEITVLVTGSAKAEIVQKMFAHGASYPINSIKPVDGNLTFVLDSDAAALI